MARKGEREFYADLEKTNTEMNADVMLLLKVCKKTVAVIDCGDKNEPWAKNILSEIKAAIKKVEGK